MTSSVQLDVEPNPKMYPLSHTQAKTSSVQLDLDSNIKAYSSPLTVGDNVQCAAVP